MDDSTYKERFQLILSHNLMHSLNTVDAKLVDAYCERQKVLLHNFCNSLGTVNDSDVDVEPFVLESVSTFFGTFAEHSNPRMGQLKTHNLMVAYSRQLSINTYVTDTSFVLILDLLPVQVMSRADIMYHWIAGKYSHELSLNKTH